MRIVVGVSVIKDGKILLIQEAKEKVRGQWNFPAGHLDDNEYIADAAVREMKEETGYDVKLKNLVGIFSSNNERPHFVIFGGEIVSGELELDPEEILDARWVPLSELGKYQLRMPKIIFDEVIRISEGGEAFTLDIIKEIR